MISLEDFLETDTQSQRVHHDSDQHQDLEETDAAVESLNWWMRACSSKPSNLQVRVEDQRKQL
jgi:hypothetical protein